MPKELAEEWQTLRQARSRRQFWIECPHCKERFGTGTKVAPGARCRHSRQKWHPEWIAPGNRGDDWRAAGFVGAPK